MREWIMDFHGHTLGTPPIAEAFISASRILLEILNRSSCPGVESVSATP